VIERKSTTLKCHGLWIDEAAIVDELATAAIVTLGSQHIGEPHLPAAQRRQWERQEALPLVPA
jgi:hypothetical protein